MTISLKNIDEFYHKIYFEPNNEFEEVRELCLSEDNWLRNLYTKENLKIENHFGYAVAFYKPTNEPVGMAGVFNDGRYPKHVARHLHRQYLFPKFRQTTREGLVDFFRLYKTHLLNPLTEANDFEVYFLAMQNRDKKSSKGYWKIFSGIAIQEAPEWKLGTGYIQTCPYNVQKCWQNYIYTEKKDGAFNEWKQKLMTHAEWETLELGT